MPLLSLVIEPFDVIKYVGSGLSSQLGEKNTFSGTITNFFTRLLLLLCLSFVLLVGVFPFAHVAKVAIVWGILHLTTLTYLVARERKVKPLLEVLKHMLVAAVVISASMMIGHWIGNVLS